MKVAPQPSTAVTSSCRTVASPQVSLAVAVAIHASSEPGPDDGAGHSIVTSAGATSTGGVVSLTVYVLRGRPDSLAHASTAQNS